MEEELEQARESYVGEEDAHELDEPGQVGASARLSLLQKVAPARRGRLSNSWPFEPARDELLSVAEYNALQTLSIARNYDGIAHAQAEKPKRQIDRDAKTTEQPLYVEGADGTSWGGEGQIERLGDDKTAALRQTVHLAHHFDRADLDDILAYKTAERTTAFLKELQETGFMQHEGLPPPADQTRVAMRREDLLHRILAPYEGLAHLNDVLADVIDKQRSTFGSKACPAAEQEADPDVPLDPDQPLPRHPLDDGAAARFASSCDSTVLPYFHHHSTMHKKTAAAAATST